MLEVGYLHSFGLSYLILSLELIICLSGMQATIQNVASCCCAKLQQVEIVSSSPQVELSLEFFKKKSKHRVSFGQKLQLIAFVRNGATIAKAAEQLSINYSTAKSIFQNIKARADGKYKRKHLIQSSYERPFQDKDGEWTHDPTKFK